MKEAKERKVIHYCWFGRNPLSKMAKKCIRSWKKFLPDYEIIEWNEDNFDINICPFVKQAYEKKKWAFVSDYARLYALYNYGGIYFDTDMELLKKIDHLVDKEIFLGYEENKKIAAGVIGVKGKKNKYVKELLSYYDSIEEFDEDAVFQFAIPVILTREFNKYQVKTENGVDIYDDNIYVYPEEYCYPINYNYSKKIYTDNTCMVHYYSASWVPRSEKIAATTYRVFGKNLGGRILRFYYFVCNLKNRILEKIKNTIWKIKHFLIKKKLLNRKLEKITKMVGDNKGDYLVITHPNWIGVGNVAKDNFTNIMYLEEVDNAKEAELIADIISKNNYKIVIFNGFATGWKDIAERLKINNNDLILKIIWHGSHALLTEHYDMLRFKEVHQLYNNRVIAEIGFVKKSMYEFYKKKGYNVSFLMNSINIDNKERYISNKSNRGRRIGLYASGERWVKNFYNQLSAISLVDDVVLDCIPLNPDANFLSNCFNLRVMGKSSNVERDELLSRMAQNDLNMYVTFTECAPLIPLESLELGIPCITGNNHHYFEGTELEKYLIVDKVDNIMEIYKKIEIALNNKEKIIELYKEWKKDYSVESKKSMDKFVSTKE